MPAFQIWDEVDEGHEAEFAAWATDCKNQNGGTFWRKRKVFNAEKALSQVQSPELRKISKQNIVATVRFERYHVRTFPTKSKTAQVNRKRAAPRSPSPAMLGILPMHNSTAVRALCLVALMGLCYVEPLRTQAPTAPSGSTSDNVDASGDKPVAAGMNGVSLPVCTNHADDLPLQKRRKPQNFMESFWQAR